MNKRNREQKIECLRKAISNAKEHQQANDPPRIYSQYVRYAIGQFKGLNVAYTSTEAKDLERKLVTHEHVVPHSIVMKKILSLEVLTDENIMSVINKYYIICIITKAEDKLLNAAKLRSKMPKGWNDKTDSVFARYEHEEVNIPFMRVE